MKITEYLPGFTNSATSDNYFHLEKRSTFSNFHYYIKGINKFLQNYILIMSLFTKMKER